MSQLPIHTMCTCAHKHSLNVRVGGWLVLVFVWSCPILCLHPNAEAQTIALRRYWRAGGSRLWN